MIAWFARNHVAANILMVSIFIAGLFSLSQKVPLEVFPSIEFDMVSVSVSMRGASPQDMEQGVAILLEQAIEDLDGLEKVVSRSVEGLATLNIDISDGHDAKEILTDIKNRIDAISNLPLAADRPVVSLSQRRREVISVVVAGEVSELEIRQKAEQVRDELISRPGISQVDLDGVRNYEIAIEVSQFKLQQYQMTLQDVSTAVKNESSDLTAGNLRTSGSDILISSRGQRYSRPEFEIGRAHV